MPNPTSAVATPSCVSEPSLDPQSLERLRALLNANADAMVAAFYQVLLNDPDAQTFLHHSIVQERLSPSLRRWLIDLFAPDLDTRDAAFIARQTKIGEVHARIKIPMHLVMAGAAVLKARLADDLAGDAAAFGLLRLAGQRIDHALRLMSQSYEKGASNRARLDEAYRLFSLDQDIHFERESQRASLMEWSQKTLFRILASGGVDGAGALGASPFGLWIRHRADFLFDGSPHLTRLNATMERIDTELLPRFTPDAAPADLAAPLKALEAAVEEVAFLLNEMFQGLAGMEGGRDPLTRALNRRFLSSILSREIGFANANHTPPVGAAAGRGPLQADQRHARPSGRRRGAAPGGRGRDRERAAQRLRLPLRRRGVPGGPGRNQPAPGRDHRRTDAPGPGGQADRGGGPAPPSASRPRSASPPTGATRTRTI